MSTTTQFLQKQNALPLTIFLGGTRSGKSSLAEEYATWCAEAHAESDRTVLYVATAEACDTSMQNRIERHQARRPESWKTVEIPCNLAQKLEAYLQAEQNAPCTILIDCVTLWLSNILFALEKNVEATGAQRLSAQMFEDVCVAEIIELFDVMRKYQDTEWIMVSGETGLGGIGSTHIERIFQDGLGLVNQHIAQVAKQRFFCIAGCAMPLGIERPWH